MSPSPADVYGVVSLIFWSITLVVTVKYVWLVLRADNDGEGGTMALAALVQTVVASTSVRRAASTSARATVSTTARSTSPSPDPASRCSPGTATR